MLGKTHHAGGTVAALIAFEVMRSKGWLVSDCTIINDVSFCIIW